jgi:hypothetical protein
LDLRVETRTQRADPRVFGALVAGAADLHRPLRVDVELQMQHPLGELTADLKPAFRNTRTIWVFSARTSAANRRTPRSRAAAARCSSRIEPSPRFWWSSRTTNVASAGPTTLVPSGPSVPS